jgi:hypothetical protein
MLEKWAVEAVKHRTDANPQPLGSVIARAQLKLDIKIADVSPEE